MGKMLIEIDDECACENATHAPRPAPVAQRKGDRLGTLLLLVLSPALFVAAVAHSAPRFFCEMPAEPGIVAMFLGALIARALCSRKGAGWPLGAWAIASLVIMGLWGAGPLQWVSVCM